jgi:putative SOS response-associated peptidase YedK
LHCRCDAEAAFTANVTLLSVVGMCSDYRTRVELIGVERALAQAGIALSFPEGRPNFEPRDDVRITDRAPILRASASISLAAELVQRRWSWPGAGGKPVYNFRSDNREFTSGRCVIVADGFYEFTKHTDPKSKRKHKWLFTMKGEPWFGIAGLWRNSPDVGEAFTMLTTEPGADVAPYHNRQIVVLPPSSFVRWLDPLVPAHEVLKAPVPGTLEIEQVY